jgi:hypothetical protein
MKDATKWIVVIGLAVFLSLLACRFWSSNIHVGVSGAPLETVPVVIDARTAEGDEMRRITETLGWRDDPKLVARYEELCGCKIPD